MTPTHTAYAELQSAYDHFNDLLFDGELPTCLITFQREKQTYGYFSSRRFINKEGGATDEIAMNPAYFSVMPVEEIMQTLVHEMVHLWQFHFGSPGRRAYHNREWADKMESIGLMPSSTHKEGGARTGEKMGDYIITDGQFDEACKTLLTKNFRISWADAHPARESIEEAVRTGAVSEIRESLTQWGIEVSEDEETVIQLPVKKPTRTKFTCITCNASAWGKSSLNLLCGDCNKPFIAVGINEQPDLSKEPHEAEAIQS